MSAEDTSEQAKKRKRGPYLSYLSDPHHQVPRSTLNFWSQGPNKHASKFSNENSGSCDTSNTTNVGNESGEAERGSSLEEHYHYTDTYENSEVVENNPKTNLTCTSLPSINEYSNISEFETDHVCGLPEAFIGPDDACCSVDSGAFFADDYEEPWEDVWEDNENDEDLELGEDDFVTTKEEEMEEKPLFSGARITVGASLLLLITFVMRHSLSGVALKDLLTLVDLHLISPNCFTRSMSTLRRFFKELKNPVQFHYYCCFCYEYIGVERRACCTNKHCLQDLTKKNSLSYFIVIPLEPQLEALFASKYITHKTFLKFFLEYHNRRMNLSGRFSVPRNTVYTLKVRLNRSNMFVKHYPTLLDATCLARLNSTIRHVGQCWRMLDNVG